MRCHSNRFGPVCWFWLVLSVLVLLFPASVLLDEVCPQQCVCHQQTINCTRTKLQYFPPELPDWTQVLLLNDNPLVTIVAQHNRLIVPPINLTHLNLADTQLFSLKPSVLEKLFNDVSFIDHSLQELILDNNLLKEFPQINNVTNLRTLSLGNNLLTYDSIKDVDLSIYPFLETLNLSNNAIKTIPKHFLSSKSHQIKHLTTLVLQNCQIQVIQGEAFDMFSNLNVLRLSKNNIDIITSDWLSNLKQLKELDLNSNQIDKIGQLPFTNSKQLQILKLRRNKLAYLPDGSFYGLGNLLKLHLDHNNLTNITLSWTYGLNSVTEISIRHNLVSKIQDTAWGPTPNLQELNLNFNKLERIEKDTLKLSALKTLRLSNNLISYIDKNAFSPLTSIDTLDLSNNQLSSAIETSNGFFSNMHTLKKLRLDHNKIQVILKQTFAGLSELTLLNLDNNPISSIQNGSFSWFKNINDLKLKDTDLLCDCSVKWLLEWFQQSEIRRSFASKLRCKHPTSLFHKTANSFLDASMDEFQCQPLLKPYLIDDFQNIEKPISAIKGKNMTFYCKVATSSKDRIRFDWLKDGQVIDKTFQRVKNETLTSPYSKSATLYTNVFTIINVDNEDQGNYQCKAENSIDKVYSHKFQMNVHVIPYFIKKPENATVKVGATARLECDAKGEPTPSITWHKEKELKDGHSFPAAKERRLRFMPNDSVIFFENVKLRDGGFYTCNVTNDAGTLLKTLYLNVVQSPVFRRKLETSDLQGYMNSSVNLDCATFGSPQPNITWYKDGKELPQNNLGRHFFTNDKQTLVIEKLNPSDEGHYSCIASNPFGEETRTFFVKVSFSRPPAAVPPSIDRIFNGNVLEGFLTFMRNHGLIILIVLLCVIITSVVWIFVIYFIRRNERSFIKNNTSNRNNENYSDRDEETCELGMSRNVQTKLPKQFYSQFAEHDDQDHYSESSSARDTGIEEGCDSNQDENEQLYSFSPQECLHPYPYQSLQRDSRRYSNNINQMSLPRNHLHHIPCQMQIEVSDSSENHYNLAMSTKERRLMLKRIKDHQISSQKQNPINAEFTNSQLKTFSSRSFSVNDISYR